MRQQYYGYNNEKALSVNNLPAYDVCVRIAFDRLRAAMLRTVPLAAALADDPLFATRQYKDAGFDLREQRALIRPLQEHVQ